MSKGLLAQWRGNFIARGSLAAVLLTVPIAVAAAIGFQGSVSGLTGGLDSLASGPDQNQVDAIGPADSLDDALLSVAADDGAPGGPPAPDGSNGGFDGGIDGPTPGSGGGGAGGGGTTGPGTGTDTPAPGTGINLPDVLPEGGGGASGGGRTGIGPVDDLLGGVNDTVNGLLGGGN